LYGNAVYEKIVHGYSQGQGITRAKRLPVFLCQAEWLRQQRPGEKLELNRIDMPFIKKDGLKGRIYVPEKTPANLKKHPCRDCEYCQQCGDERCELCLKQKCDQPSKP